MANTIHDDAPPERVAKLDAARRQLATAITLWFNDGDTVSIYTLSHAAYEIIHNFSKKFRYHDLLFDTLIIKDEYRKDFNNKLREPANFFKHHRHNDPDELNIQFHPEICQSFFLFSILGLELTGIPPKDEEAAFAWWYMINTPGALTQKGHEQLSQYAPVEHLEEIRLHTKKQFFEAFMEGRRRSST